MAYQLPPAKPWGAEPWPYSPLPPQRFTTNRDRYLDRGGLVRIEDDMQRFVAEGRNADDPARFFFFSLMLDQIQKEGIAGDLAEIGVYKGDTAVLIADMARKLGKTAYFLDTFEGFSAQDLQGVDANIAMEFADTSLDVVRARVGEESAHFVQGYFPGTARELPEDGRYSLVHIDCDLYAPINSALDYFYPRMSPGGYIVIHDYSSLHWPGAERAVDEFFADKPESVVGMPDGSGSAIVRRIKSPDTDNWLQRQRLALVGGEWIAASNPAVSNFLVDGWSGQESWGVWGIGPEHVVSIPLPHGRDISSMQVDIEATTVLMGPRMEQVVEVVLDGSPVDRWTFTHDTNHTIHSIVLQPTPAMRESGTLTFGFRPGETQPPSMLDPANQDARSLGLGVFRFRFTPL